MRTRVIERGATMRQVWGWVLCVALLVAALPAAAQDARARARASFGEGVTAYEAGRYREALASFEQAYRAAPHPAVRVNMANCFEQLGQYVEALFNFRRFLEEMGDSVDPEQRSEVESAIARLTPRVATLVVTLEPANAALTVDGKEPRRTPDGRVQVVAGVHAFRAAAPGYLPVERSVDSKGGAEMPLTITLQREGEAASEALDEPPVAAPAEESASEPLVSAPPDELPRDDRPAPFANKALVWTGVGITGLLAVGAGVSGVIALGANRDFDEADARSRDVTLSDADRLTARQDGVIAADRANNAALMSDVFLGGAAVAGVATLWIWVHGRRHGVAEGSALTVHPFYARRDAAGLGLSGRF